MGRLLVLLLALLPLIEIAGFVVIGQAIGLWATLAGVLLAALAGALLVRVQGLSLLAEIRSTLAHGRLPARTLADAMMVCLAGLLLLLPGYFSDLVGLLLLLPPIRQVLYGFLGRRIKVVSATGGGAGPAGAPPELRDGSLDLDEEEWRRR